MTQDRNLAEAVNRIERLDKDIAGIVATRRERWRYELIHARRELSDVLAHASAALSGGDGTLKLEYAKLRDKLSTFRFALALH